MRCVRITRKKSFCGSAIPYFIFVGYRKAEIDSCNPQDEWDFPSKSDTRIANGQTITVPIRDEKCCIFAGADAARSITLTKEQAMSIWNWLRAIAGFMAVNISCGPFQQSTRKSAEATLRQKKNQRIESL